MLAIRCQAEALTPPSPLHTAQPERRRSASHVNPNDDTCDARAVVSVAAGLSGEATPHPPIDARRARPDPTYAREAAGW